MTIARFIRAAAVATAGALVSVGAAHAAPSLNFATGNVAAPSTAVTPVYYGPGYNPYYYPGYHPRRYYQPPYQPYYQQYPQQYYQPYYNNYGYDQGYRYRNPGGIYIRTPGLRLGIGF